MIMGSSAGGVGRKPPPTKSPCAIGRDIMKPELQMIAMKLQSRSADIAT